MIAKRKKGIKGIEAKIFSVFWGKYVENDTIVKLHVI